MNENTPLLTEGNQVILLNQTPPPSTYKDIGNTVEATAEAPASPPSPQQPPEPVENTVEAIAAVAIGDALLTYSPKRARKSRAKGRSKGSAKHRAKLRLRLESGEAIETQSQLGSQSGSQLGGEGVQVAGDEVAKMLTPNLLKSIDKGFSGGVLGDSPELYNEVVALVDKRIKAHLKARDEARPVEVEEEKPVMFNPEVVPIVWHIDGEGAMEAEIVAAPRNPAMRLIRFPEDKPEDGDNTHVLWVDRNLIPMVGFRVSVKPSNVEGEAGYRLCGEYGRKGGRIH
jgi:hypothetical protein